MMAPSAKTNWSSQIEVSLVGVVNVGLLWPIVNEKPLARPEEVLRMGPAYFRVFARNIRRACIPEIAVEGVFRQLVIEKVAPTFNWRYVRLASKCASILHGKVLDVLNRRPLEPITSSMTLNSTAKSGFSPYTMNEKSPATPKSS